MNVPIVIGLILFLPLVGGLAGAFFPLKKGGINSLFLGMALLLSLTVMVALEQTFTYQWEWVPGFFLGIHVDRVAILLISLVLFVSLLVSIFSIKYMERDKGMDRYYAKLGFFVFAMVGLLLADHLILLFVFWELVGLASYLLIGFWFKKENVPASARTAFMVNRVADVALLAGILILYSQTGNLFASEINAGILLIPSVLIAIGAFGKSAQFPFSGWLTKAMVGPTPVSALIHAATMVAAGVYLLFRLAPFLHPDAMTIIAVIGAVTALFGGLSALNQHDIKKVLAYSTISQLGYMVVGIGVGARDAALLHLLTHAFFKAGLFLAAASIIHYLHQTSTEDAQDMRTMGGLKNKLPWTFRTFLVCGAALAGVPFFSGFLSKDGILLAAWSWASEMGSWAYIVPDIAFLVALITAFYVGRMILLVFMGEPRVELKRYDLGESKLFGLPFLMLSLFSLWVIYNINPLGHNSWLSEFWGAGPEGASVVSGGMVASLSILLVGVGLVLSFVLFNPKSTYAKAYHLVDAPSGFGGKLLSEGMYLTQLYSMVGRLIHVIARVMKTLDRRVIDAFIHLLAVGSVVISKVIALFDRFLVDGPVNWVSSISAFVGRRLAGLSGRDVQDQVTWLLLVVILILGWIVLF